MSTSPALSRVRRLPVPVAAAVLASLCVVSTGATSAAVGGHHRASVVDAGAAVRVAPSRKEY